MHKRILSAFMLNSKSLTLLVESKMCWINTIFLCFKIIFNSLQSKLIFLNTKENNAIAQKILIPLHLYYLLFAFICNMRTTFATFLKYILVQFSPKTYIVLLSSIYTVLLLKSTIENISSYMFSFYHIICIFLPFVISYVPVVHAL